MRTDSERAPNGPHGIDSRDGQPASAELTAMSKRELIEKIMQLNRTARREFLQAFTENELADYLRQLESVQPISIGYEARRSDR